MIPFKIQNLREQELLKFVNFETYDSKIKVPIDMTNIEEISLEAFLIGPNTKISVKLVYLGDYQKLINEIR